MGKSMGNRECEWIGDRLPLWVENGDCDDSMEGRGERGDLTARERQEIEQHLARCARCHSHRLALERALDALAIAANQLPIGPDMPSLWPLLEQRIADHVTSGQRHWPRLLGSQQLTTLLFTTTAAAASLLLVTGIWTVHRRWTIAENTIVATVAPLADPLPVLPAVEEPTPETATRNSSDFPINQLADAEPTRPPETTTQPAVEVALPKSSRPTRFGFDLEHGTPMPPDTRDAKPVY